MASSVASSEVPTGKPEDGAQRASKGEACVLTADAHSLASLSAVMTQNSTIYRAIES
jgi:hypothetical protein